MSTKGFDERVYEFCSRIPRGKVSSYGEIARAMGKPGASRAVGQALKRNPYAPRVPCHRIIRSDGSLGGFGGPDPKKIAKKILLLRKEGVRVEKNRVNMDDYIYRF